MSHASVSLTQTATGYDQRPASAVGDQAAVAAAVTTVAANVATLVADGASPTQGHVTTLNTNWGVLNTAAGLVTNDLNADVTLIFDDAKITSRALLRAAVEELYLRACGMVPS